MCGCLPGRSARVGNWRAMSGGASQKGNRLSRETLASAREAETVHGRRADRDRPMSSPIAPPAARPWPHGRPRSRALADQDAVRVHELEATHADDLVAPLEEPDRGDVEPLRIGGRERARRCRPCRPRRGWRRSAHVRSRRRPSDRPAPAHRGSRHPRARAGSHPRTGARPRRARSAGRSSERLLARLAPVEHGDRFVTGRACVIDARSRSRPTFCGECASDASVIGRPRVRAASKQSRVRIELAVRLVEARARDLDRDPVERARERVPVPVDLRAENFTRSGCASESKSPLAPRRPSES